MRRPTVLTLAALLLAGGASTAAIQLRDPQSKVFAAAYKAQQLLLAPTLAPARLGDGGPAPEVLLCDPMGLALDAGGRLYVSDRGRRWRGRIVWRIEPDGTAHAVAGTGRQGVPREGRALEASFGKPEGLALDSRGRLHLADAVRHAVYRVDADGRVTRIAGTGSSGFSGDGGPARDARLNRPAQIRFDGEDNLYVADVFNHRVRMVDPEGRIRTVAGTGEPGFSADGTLALEARLDHPWGVGIDGQGRLLVSDSGNHRIRRVEGDGTLVTVAGSERGFSGDGGPATLARFDEPQALAVDGNGWLFIGDEHNHAVRVVEADGTVRTIAGIGTRGRARIGSPAEGAPLDDPENLVVLEDGSVVVVEGRNARVIRITPEGTIRHLAGRGTIEECTSRRIRTPHRDAEASGPRARLGPASGTTRR